MLEDFTSDRRVWMIIRQVFKAEFVTKSDDKLILDGLAHLAMKPVENVRNYVSCLNKMNAIIMDAYETYQILPEEPGHDNADNVNLKEMQAYVRK